MNTIDREFLIEQLKQGEVEVTFTKSDGTERVMKCTLKEGVVVPYEKKTERVKKHNDDILAVWDLEIDEWRSFKLSSIIAVSAGVN